LSRFRRFGRRSKTPTEVEPSGKTELGEPSTSEDIPTIFPEISPTISSTPPPKKEVQFPTAISMGRLIASSDEITIDKEKTVDFAKRAKISPQTAAEIVPGKVLKRDEEGRVHIKIVFYGPSLSGKTTALRWLFANVRSLAKGKLVEISDELGRTTFFDFVPVSASERMVFDVFTVAGQRRHAGSRIKVLRDCDGLIFMADSTPEQMNENLASIQELRIALGTDRMAMLPIIVSLNKRDLPNALPVDYMVNMLDLEGYPVFATIATEGVNLLRMFQRVLRDALIFKVGI
jgi:signal recognition particle receptor subunit beta